MPEPGGNWSEYKLRVIDAIDKLEKSNDELRKEVVNLKIKVAVWSALAAAAGGGLGSIAKLFM